jgi:hypothetical protein
MPDAQLTNPTGAGYYNLVQNGGLILDFEIDSTVSGDSPIGTLVELKGYTGPGTGPRSTPPTVVPSSTTADKLVVGVIVGGQTTNEGQGTSIAPGQVAQVMVAGVCQVLCDATTTEGVSLVQSAATAGCAKDGSGTLVVGEVIGTALQAVTISSGTALVWALIGKQ